MYLYRKVSLQTLRETFLLLAIEENTSEIMWEDWAEKETTILENCEACEDREARKRRSGEESLSAKGAVIAEKGSKNGNSSPTSATNGVQ